MSQTRPHNHKASQRCGDFSPLHELRKQTSLALIPHVQKFSVAGGYDVASAFVHGAI
jgi:hypothetical protein